MIVARKAAGLVDAEVDGIVVVNQTFEEGTTVVTLFVGDGVVGDDVVGDGGVIVGDGVVGDGVVGDAGGAGDGVVGDSIVGDLDVNGDAVNDDRSWQIGKERCSMSRRKTLSNW